MSVAKAPSRAAAIDLPGVAVKIGSRLEPEAQKEGDPADEKRP